MCFRQAKLTDWYPPASYKFELSYRLIASTRNRLQIRIQQRIHLFERLAHEEHRIERIDRLRDPGDRFDVERGQDHLASQVSFAGDAQFVVKPMDHIPALVLG